MALGTPKFSNSRGLSSDCSRLVRRVLELERLDRNNITRHTQKLWKLLFRTLLFMRSAGGSPTSY